MAYLDALTAYVPQGVGRDGRPNHVSSAPTTPESVHEMVEAAARQLDAATLSRAAEGMAATFHCGSLYQGEHFWPIQNSLQHNVLGHSMAGAATEVKQFCSGGLFGVMLADAVLEAGWGGDYAMVTGGDRNFFFDRHDYAASPFTEGSLMGDSAFCAILNRHRGFARIMSVAARSHNASADMMRSRTDHGIDDPAFPELQDWISRFEDHERRSPGSAAQNARASFQTAVDTVVECYRRVGLSATDIDWFLPSYLEPRGVSDGLAARTGLRQVPGHREFASRFGHLTVSDFGVNLVYLLNHGIAKTGDLVLLFAAGNFVNSAAVLLRIENEVTLPFNAPI